MDVTYVEVFGLRIWIDSFVSVVGIVLLVLAGGIATWHFERQGRQR